MEIPTCTQYPEHGEMVLLEPMSEIAAWCGTWFQCETCKMNILILSDELKKQHSKGTIWKR